MGEQPIYVVVMATGGAPTEDNPKGGPIVMETDVESATRETAQARASALERRFGACRVARLVFEDVDGRPL